MSQTDAALSLVLEPVTVISNTCCAPGVFELVLDAPRVASTVQPGQFVHLRVTRATDILLRRPLSVHRIHREHLHFLYQVVGKGTSRLSDTPVGTRLDLIGPLGAGWTLKADTECALLVAGGVGVAPMGMLAQACHARGIRAVLALGAASRNMLLGLPWFLQMCDRVELATDDGSEGTRGYVTALLDDLIDTEKPSVIYSCGPEVMQNAVANHALSAGIPCQVSLERRMACGIGACLSCVVTTCHGLKRACVDGPVFDAKDVLWDDAEVTIP